MSCYVLLSYIRSSFLLLKTVLQSPGYIQMYATHGELIMQEEFC